MSREQTALRGRSRAGLLTGVVLALLLLGGLLGPEFVLVRDMVFVPRLPLSPAVLGLDGVPRAVPSDLLVALASRVLPGGWLQDLVLLGVVVGGAWGAARLVPTGSRVGAVAAGTAYGWSAYLHERLLLGQWALLVGWAVLPWAARAALDWRAGGSWSRPVACLAVGAGGGASAGLLVALVVLPCAGLRRLPASLGATVVLALPWLVPSLLGEAPRADPAGVAAFASDADTPLGVLGSLLTLGGVWAPAAVPAGRGTAWPAAVLVLVVAAVGLPLLARRLPLVPLAVAAGLGLLLAVAGRVPGLDALLRAVVVHVPGGGLLRDQQKWVAPLGVLVAAAAGCGVEVLQPRLRLAGVVAVLAPLAALPAGLGLAGSRYPDDWLRVATAVDAAPQQGPVVVLPWTLYRAFPWTGDRTVLDPFPRLVSRRVVVDDDLPLARGSVRGEDRLADVVDRGVARGGPLLPALREAGASLVVVERTTRGADPALLAEQVEGLEAVLDTPEIALYAVPRQGRAPHRLPLLPVVLGHAAAAALGLSAAAAVVVRRRATGPARR